MRFDNYINEDIEEEEKYKKFFKDFDLYFNINSSGKILKRYNLDKDKNFLFYLSNGTYFNKKQIIPDIDSQEVYSKIDNDVVYKYNIKNKDLIDFSKKINVFWYFLSKDNNKDLDNPDTSIVGIPVAFKVPSYSKHVKQLQFEEVKEKFKVGDRIIVKNDIFIGSHDISNQKGTIVKVGFDLLINFDNYVGGHSGNGNIKLGHGWFVDKHDVKLLKSTSNHVKQLKFESINEITLEEFGKLDSKNGEDINGKKLNVGDYVKISPIYLEWLKKNVEEGAKWQEVIDRVKKYLGKVGKVEKVEMHSSYSSVVVIINDDKFHLNSMCFEKYIPDRKHVKQLDFN